MIYIQLVSCTTSKILITGNTYPPYEGQVKIYQSPPEDVEYEEIGWVSVQQGEFSSSQWVDLIALMQKKAAEKGANAIILTKGGEATHAVMFEGSGGAYSLKSMMGIAVRVNE